MNLEYHHKRLFALRIASGVSLLIAVLILFITVKSNVIFTDATDPKFLHFCMAVIGVPNLAAYIVYKAVMSYQNKEK